jgi:hypothetical protein
VNKMSTNAKAAFGTTFSWGGQVVAELTSIGGVKTTVDTLDVTNHQSPGGVEEAIPTIVRTGTVPITGNFVVDANGQQAMVTDTYAKTKREVIITGPNSCYTETFNAYIVSIDPVGEATHDGKLSFTAEVKVTSTPVFAFSTSAGLTTPFFAISESAVLSPAAAGNVYDYVATVLNAVDSVTVTPTASAGVITVNGNVVTSGEASSAIALSVGVNIVTVVVTETNKAPKTYTIRIVRAAS